MASHNRTPRMNLISPTPTPTEVSAKDGYFGPMTRSVSKAKGITTPAPVSEDPGSPSSDPEKRARTRSRSPLDGKGRKIAPLTMGSTATAVTPSATRRKAEPVIANGTTNGHLELPKKKGWREISRSPSPLGIIPIHTRFRSFIHRHEIPRKFLHVSIGFVTTYLYAKGARTTQIYPVLLTALIPIATADFIRHHYAPFNRFYVRMLGAMMRETEVDGYNGVIWYLLGTWAVLRFCPKDVGVMGVLLLSWCDTAASTFGRLWGRYTPKIRKGKSLAGTLAAMIVGFGTAVMFWGWVAPVYGEVYGLDTGDQAFAYQGVLSLPKQVKGLLGWGDHRGVITGNLALGVMSLWAGFIAGASEAIDLFGWDDNFTIPVLCGAGLWGFLEVFG